METEENGLHGIPKLANAVITRTSGSSQWPSIQAALKDGTSITISINRTQITYRNEDPRVEIAINTFDNHINHCLLQRIRRGQADTVLRWLDLFLAQFPSQFKHGNYEALTRACVEISTFAERSVTAVAGNHGQRSVMQFSDRDTPEKSPPLMAIARWINWRAGVEISKTKRAIAQPTTHGFFLRNRPPATTDHIWVALAGKRDPRREIHAGSTAHEQIAAHRRWRDEIVPQGHAVRAEIAKHSHFSSRQLEAMIQALGFNQ